MKRLEKENQELVRKKTTERSSDFEKFGLKYYNHPHLFAKECIQWAKDESLTPYQEEILANIPAKKRICVRAPHSAGKSSCVAIASLWFALTREAVKKDWKCVATASVGTQLRDYYFPEVKKWARSLKWDLIGRDPFDLRRELLTDAIHLTYGRLICVRPEKPVGLEGAHAKSIFYIFDEGKAIRPEIYDAAEGAFAGSGNDAADEAFAAAVSTPGDKHGRFYQIQSRKPGYEDWWPRNITLEEIIAAGRISEEFVEKRRRQWGATSAAFIQRVLGDFASDDKDGIIPLSWVERALEEEAELEI